ncbi:hypothetical protein [Candidatus Tisiphia endosymbiont of Thecophora atra]|uniref:hypothetical protein n=1 Tax=Candidatus Tisiphia endosymbiont of Thecophora atra TaxID=3066258 RepID=UPI00312CB5A0
MERVRFNNCLNKHVRFWNISIGSIVGGISFGLIILCFKGVLWSFAGGAIGFAIGGWFMHQWWLGIIQRWLYWHLPLTRLIISANLPKSHVRLLM